MTDILSLWRAPLDKVALSEACALADRQPRCSIGFGEDFSLMTIYNYGYYIDHTVGNATDALNTMFGTMSGASPIGGRAFIPQKSFGVTAPLLANVPDQCDIDGSGGGGTLGSTSGSTFYHFVVTPLGPGASTFLNCVNGPQGHTSGGMYFRSLAFQWGASTEAKDTCIYADVWNVRAINCTFTDCPRAFNAQDLSCTLEQCTINYTVSATQGPNDTIAVILSAPQCGVIGPSQFAQRSPAPGSGGATGCTCILIEGAEHALVSGVEILEWTIGIDFSQGVQHSNFTHITNCDIECWQTALNILLAADASGTTSGIKVTSCLLAKTSDSTDGHPIVNISTNGNASDMLNDIALIDCTVVSLAANAPSNQYGLQIVSGSNIRVIGGTYSNNSVSGGAGIAITGSPTDVQIIGANLQPSYPGSPTVRNQQYGLLITGSPDYVLVSGCDITGYSHTGQHAVEVMGGTPAKLFIHDCPGYNDQNTGLNGGMIPTSSTNAATCTTPYFGPSVIIYSGTASAVLNFFGQTITSNFGIIFLPSPYDSFYFTTPPTTFSWIGK